MSFLVADSEDWGPAVLQGVPDDSSVQRLADIEKALVEISEISAESLDGVFDFDEHLPDPPRAVTDLIIRFARQEQSEAHRYSLSNPERRRETRVPCSRAVIAVPVDRNFVRVGEPFKAAIRDISEHGIRLLDTRACNAQYLALSWHAEILIRTQIDVAIKVLECRVRSPFYNIAGSFVFAD